jgi:hypothetical protein
MMKAAPSPSVHQGLSAMLDGGAAGRPLVCGQQTLSRLIAARVRDDGRNRRRRMPGDTKIALPPCRRRLSEQVAPAGHNQTERRRTILFAFAYKTAAQRFVVARREAAPSERRRPRRSALAQTPKPDALSAAEARRRSWSPMSVVIGLPTLTSSFAPAVTDTADRSGGRGLLLHLSGRTAHRFALIWQGRFRKVRAN